MSSGICTVYGAERKGSQNAPGGGSSTAADSTGPNKSAGVAHAEQPDRVDWQTGHHKLRAWKDADSSLPCARRACTYPETPKRTSVQV